jgi:molybdopterin-guanine dinucleotide biosynthesis protein A
LPPLPFEGAGYAAEMPVIGLWPVALAPLLDAWLALSEDRSMRGWARSVGVPAVSIGPLANINRPEDLRALG